MKRLLILALLPLAGCANDFTGQANYRPPRPDELRPGDIPPPPGPFIDSMPNATRVAPPSYAPRAYVPLPTGEALRAQQPQPYMMPTIPPQTVCNTQRFGNQLQTVCQ